MIYVMDAMKYVLAVIDMMTLSIDWKRDIAGTISGTEKNPAKMTGALNANPKMNQLRKCKNFGYEIKYHQHKNITTNSNFVDVNPQ